MHVRVRLEHCSARLTRVVCTRTTCQAAAPIRRCPTLFPTTNWVRFPFYASSAIIIALLFRVAGFCAKRADGKYRNDGNCHTFYVCSRGRTFEQACNGTLVYDPRLEICNWAINVPECSSEATPKPLDPGMLSLRKATICCKGYQRAKITIFPECANRQDGFYAHQSDQCSRDFYSCVDGLRRDEHCPNGLCFIPCLQRCDWPSEASKCNALPGSILTPISSNASTSN